MFIKKISIQLFKNYKRLDETFSSGFNAISGPNGSGKTNLLDAVYYLCLCKSAFNPIDKQLIHTESDYFFIKGLFQKKDEEHTIQAGFQQNNKLMRHNNVAYDKLSDHLGKFPVVLIAPDDTAIVKEGSEIRRKFIDSILCQTNRQYLKDLLAYNRLLKYRNTTLKNDHKRTDYALLEVYDEQLLPLNRSISTFRKEFLSQFEQLFASTYQQVCGGNEEVSIQYNSQVTETSFEDDYANSIEKDILLQRTTMGIHKDDITFTIGSNPLKKFGSQGQQKTFVIALKLAQLGILQQGLSINPILLLDDIFDKLDNNRVASLMELLHKTHKGQVFITDTDPKRLDHLFDDIPVELRTFEISDGQIQQR